MIKDLEEAMYYCAITQAMEKTEEEKKYSNNINYYMEREPIYWYNGGSNGTNGNNGGNFGFMGSRMYTPYMEYAPYMMRD